MHFLIRETWFTETEEYILNIHLSGRAVKEAWRPNVLGQYLLRMKYILKCTNTRIYKYKNAQIHKYRNILWACRLLMDRIRRGVPMHKGKTQPLGMNFRCFQDLIRQSIYVK